jgi:ABC-type branched-subunit amino acid transport system ATPase component
MAMLEAENVHTYYGNIHALKGISLSVEKGEIVTLIGGKNHGKAQFDWMGKILFITKPIRSYPKGLPWCPKGGEYLPA